MKEKVKDYTITIHEAIDNLSTLSEMDFNANTMIGVIEGRFVLNDQDYVSQSIQWLAPENASEILEVLKDTYLVILRYLKELFEDPETNWEDPKIKKGIQAIMVLAGESANRVDLYLSLFPDAEKDAKAVDCKEYKELQEFYVSVFSGQFEGGLEGKKEWEKEWKENEEGLNLDIERRGLKDFETVKRDREYELFSIRSENDKPFFTPTLIRNLKLVCDFDESFGEIVAEDPLLRIHHFFDRDLRASAHQILHSIDPYMRRFYKQRINRKTDELAALLNSCMMALMLAEKEKHALGGGAKKNCISYFGDFQFFLRTALHCTEYLKILAMPEEKVDEFSHIMIDLLHHLCKALYLRDGGIKEEMIGFIYHLIHRGEEKKKQKIGFGTIETFWSMLLEQEDSIRFYLKFFPNGPLFKILDVIREEECVGFDPMIQHNLPLKLYPLQIGEKKMDLLHLPCPTRQEIISKAMIIPEFVGFLRANRSEKHGKKHLLINLQDKTSWKDYARVKIVENLQKQAELKGSIVVITIAKDTNFYFQNAEYLQISDATSFFSILKEQILSEDCGFFVSEAIKTPAFSKFLDDLIHFIHSVFFASQEKLVRKMRLDFIEIFYFFLVLKLLLELQPDTFSFSCKDGLDVGAAMGGGFYAFIKMLSQQVLLKEDEEMLLWLFYTPAFLVRERAIDSQRFNRMISALASMDTVIKNKGVEVVKGIKQLFLSALFHIRED